MKRIVLSISISIILLGMISSTSTWALDPVAPRSFRNFGMLYVETPNPAEDEITVTNLKTGNSQILAPKTVEVVPIGSYRVEVKIQEYSYTQDVDVTPTERTDVIVPGYGNLLVNGPIGAIVEAYDRESGQVTATFPTNKVKTLPRGHYDVRINLGKETVNQFNVWIATNTTRILDVIS